MGGTIVARGLSFGVPGANVIRYDNGTTEWFGHMAVGGSFEIGGTGNHRMYDGKFTIKNQKSKTENQKEFIELNAELSQVWPRITEVIAPPKDAKQWDGIPNKIDHLIIDLEEE